MTTIRVVFRVDASVQIGTGHVMRCLTLAHGLSKTGAHCVFLCREYPGNLISMIRDRGFQVLVLPISDSSDLLPVTPHYRWLGVSQWQDAEESMVLLNEADIDWIIIDHYALSEPWERRCRTRRCRLMVIDDLADRPHDCDLLLDQNLGRLDSDYQDLLPQGCQLLIGPHYALLRPEFAHHRATSLLRRASAKTPSRWLVSMGGVDADNWSESVLRAFSSLHLPPETSIIVVMGSLAPHLDAVQRTARQMPYQTRVSVDTTIMAQLMSESDLAVGAGGSTSWERCAMGLPSFVVITAENQRTVARSLEAVEAAVVLDPRQLVLSLQNAMDHLKAEPGRLAQMSRNAARIVDGLGVDRVVQQLAKHSRIK